MKVTEYYFSDLFIMLFNVSQTFKQKYMILYNADLWNTNQKKKKPKEDEMATKPKRNHETCGKLGILAKFTIKCPTTSMWVIKKKKTKLIATVKG